MKLSGITRLKVLTPPLPWDQPRVKCSKEGGEKSQEIVVCLHGLWRSMWAMEPIATFLNKQGFTTVNLPYASFRYELDEIVEQVRSVLKPWLEEGRTIHFVTHSLGGIVLRHLLESALLDEERSQIGRVVMLAPPNQGSEIIDWLHESPLRYALGPAGEFLSSDSMKLKSQHFPTGIEAAIIMGERSAIPFFRKLLAASNDGIVSVEKGHLLGIKEFKVVDADHTFIVNDPGVMDMVNSFIGTGNC